MCQCANDIKGVKVNIRFIQGISNVYTRFIKAVYKVYLGLL